MLQLPATEKSFWRESYPDKTVFPTLKTDLRVDVAIIGTGITGLTTAYLLLQEGRSVAVVDKATIAGGTSGRTTGKVTSQHNINYSQLIERHGEAVARTYAEANEAAIQQVAKTIEQEGIVCAWTWSDNYIFTTQQEHVETIKREVKAAQRLGLPATFSKTTALPFAVRAAVKFSNQAKMNAQQYLLGLADAISKKGGHIFEKSTVKRIRYRQTCKITTAHGLITAKKIVVATNVPTLPLMARGSYCFLEFPTESFAVAAATEKPLDGMYISPDSNHYSILPVNIEGRPRVIVVGAGNAVAGLRLNKKRRFQKLATYAETELGATKIVNTWSDRDYAAYDGLPLIGKLYPWSDDIYVGTAYKKWGLTNGTVAARIISDTIIGRKNKWAPTFNSLRIKPLLSMPGTLASSFFRR